MIVFIDEFRQRQYGLQRELLDRLLGKPVAVVESAHTSVDIGQLYLSALQRANQPAHSTTIEGAAEAEKARAKQRIPILYFADPRGILIGRVIREPADLDGSGPLPISPGRGESYCAACLSYLDASGKNSDPVVVVAGFLGWPAHFEWFEQQWNPLLTELGLDHFHATEFWARRSRQYRDWNDAKWLKAKGDICKILSDNRGPPIGVAYAANVDLFQQWRATLNDYYPNDPYYFCLDRVLSTLSYSTGPKDTGITIYCDQEKEHELIGTDLVRWHEARLAYNPRLATVPLPGPRR
jgi:hypothetical protein